MTKIKKSLQKSLIFGLSFLMFLPDANAYFEEGLKSTLEASSIAHLSRKCCSFALDTIPTLMELAEVIGVEQFGHHQFQRLNHKNDPVGINYSCNGGFIDLSHLRDNADWAAHIYYKLPDWLGSGLDVNARNEGGFTKRSIYFPELSPADLKELTEEDRQQIAVAIDFSLALLHEVASSFKIAVSAPELGFIYERTSAFSLEDSYSNLLGAQLGVKAVASALPYNEAMDQELNLTFTGLKGQSKAISKSAYALTRNKWWKKQFIGDFKSTMKRKYTYEGTISPLLIPKTSFCGPSTPQSLQIPDRLSNGRSVNDYFQLRGEPDATLSKYLAAEGVKIGSVITQKDFAAIIPAIRAMYIRMLGNNIEVAN